jgi:hypothetical protein
MDCFALLEIFLVQVQVFPFGSAAPFGVLYMKKVLLGLSVKTLSLTAARPRFYSEFSSCSSSENKD